MVQSAVCENSFVSKNIDFKFSVSLNRTNHNFAFYSADSEADYSTVIENTGHSTLWINSLQINFNFGTFLLL